MLKETETEKTIGIFDIFLSGVTFQSGRGRVPWSLSLATPMSTLYRIVVILRVLCAYCIIMSLMIHAAELSFCLYSMRIMEETRFAEIRREQPVNCFSQRDMCSVFV